MEFIVRYTAADKLIPFDRITLTVPGKKCSMLYKLNEVRVEPYQRIYRLTGAMGLQDVNVLDVPNHIIVNPVEQSISFFADYGVNVTHKHNVLEYQANVPQLSIF